MSRKVHEPSGLESIQEGVEHDPEKSTQTSGNSVRRDGDGTDEPDFEMTVVTRTGQISRTILDHQSDQSLRSFRDDDLPRTRPSFLRGGSSFIEGNRSIRSGVLPTSGSYRSKIGSIFAREISVRTTAFAPRRLLDIERGKSILLTDQRFLAKSRHQELGDDGSLMVMTRTIAPTIAEVDVMFFKASGDCLECKIGKGDIRDFSINNEVGKMGGAWRGFLMHLIVWSCDEVNALQLTRQIQVFIPFQTGYEAYILGQLIEAFESRRKKAIQYALKLAFKNRNVSRILVQLMGPRFDFLWHWNTIITWNRLFDAWGRLPLVGITSFPSTENFPSTRNHALASIFRVALGEGTWITRVVTQGREGLILDGNENPAQNLAPESNGFELANRNQYGTYMGRRKTNEFRFAHRLPTDESTVRTFIAQPMPTLVNNGAVHVLRQLAKHWHNMLFQLSGNFAHQRMEQLDPFETLRFHVPVVLLSLSNLRGRNQWDTRVLGPMVRSLQEIKPSFTADTARFLVSELQEKIVVNVCGGIASVVDPFFSWLEAINKACNMVEAEAKEVYEIVSSVEVGVRLGHDLITRVRWKIPSDVILKEAILNHIRGLSTGDVPVIPIRMALAKITPRDKRTLIELVKNGLVDSRPAQLLLNRAKTLLQREVRREALNQTISELSKGDLVTNMAHDDWYWLDFADDSANSGVYIYDSKSTGRDQHRFLHVDTKFELLVSMSDGNVMIRSYVPVAEAISRAQRAFMNIELDHGRKFTYDAFMEFTFLRTALRRLMVLSQVTCEELDNARLNVLAEVQRSNQEQTSINDLEPGETYYTYDSKAKEYKPFVYRKDDKAADPERAPLASTKIVRVPPQSMIVIGGGPTGLMTTIHCTESVLSSGGIMKLYEARDAFAKGGSTFERAQIVRLDARWIAMLRYHLGTGFEDVFIPASGETDPQLGNTLPTQGFVEITIKDLENMLHLEVSKMWSKGLIRVYTDSKSNYDHVTNSLTKYGDQLKPDDYILRRVNEDGRPCDELHSWRVLRLVEVQPLAAQDLKIGEDYGIYIRTKHAVMPYKLMGMDLQTETLSFMHLGDGKEEMKTTADNLPTVYPKAVTRHGEIRDILVESSRKSSRGGYVRETLSMKCIKKEKFIVDVGQSHVVECIGKPHGSKVHFSITTHEPYGVCCIQGLKISMGMHNFGEKRWGSGIVDDIRSQMDQNTRIIGDFTKMVRAAPVTKKMLQYMTDKRDKNWQRHFEALAADSGFPELNGYDAIVPKIQRACSALVGAAPGFKRQTLQTRFFETGDNYYLGMELTREYDKWKKELATDLVAPLTMKAKDPALKEKVGKLRGTLMHHIDRLWYDGVLEVIRTGDVYNPGARQYVPRIYLTNSYTDARLGSFPVGESFRLVDRPEEMYEVVIKGATHVIVRNVEGFIFRMPRSAKARREGNLTRGPDGNKESRLALATFPVGHYVNHRTLRLNDTRKGYVFAFIGDEQATPHFMRYSGLTGACINAMLFNNFIRQANRGIPFIDRVRTYSIETNWSNGEVVQRGTGANYGEDGFLRPGFSYDHGLDYLYSKIIEHRESEQDLDNILSRDWKIKMAASMVPRGMEVNAEFIRALYEQLHQHVFNKFVKEATADNRIGGISLESALKARGAEMEDETEALDSESYWDEFLIGLNVDLKTKNVLDDSHTFIAKRLDEVCMQVIEYAKEAYIYNERVSSELFNQPKPVDSILDDFAVEAQNFANSLTQSAAYASGALAFRLVGEGVSSAFSTILAVLNIFISFDTMANVSRYKIRNEEARIVFAEEKMLGVMKGVFSVMDRHQQDAVPIEQNPFVISLSHQVSAFVQTAKYYDFEEPIEFYGAYSRLKSNINDPREIRDFMTLLTTKFIVDTYHVNSYVQENLVHIYKILEDMHHLLTQDVDRTNERLEAPILFNRLSKFRDDLEGTLQRGATRFGFVKRRHLFQWDCAVVFKYFYSLLCCSCAFFDLPTAPISTKTLSILRQMRHLSGLYDSQILRREIRDLEGLYWATRESDIASLIFMSGVLVFVASIVFTIARVFHISELEDIAFWATAASAFGAILATFHLWRKSLILLRLMFTLSVKIRNAASSEDRRNIRKVCSVTFTQIILTLARLASAGAAAVALPWSVVEKGYGDKIGTYDLLPFWIALGAVCTAIGSTLFFFIVEYQVRYNLSPKLGEFVCECFRSEIEDMYEVLAVRTNDIDTKQVQERETWEYVAREFLHRYRFDTVFAADRFGSILQYIQSGMDPRE